MTLKQRLDRYLGRKPRVAEARFVADSATVVGDVVLGEGASVFYGAVLRADINSIRVGRGSNIQDNVVLHLADDRGVKIGADCTIGHGAIVHACTIGDRCLVGMGATVLDRSVIGRESLIGANALVPQGFRCPPGTLVFGSPARAVRPLSAEERQGLRRWAEKYAVVAAAHARLQRSKVRKV